MTADQAVSAKPGRRSRNTWRCPPGLWKRWQAALPEGSDPEMAMTGRVRELVRQAERQAERDRRAASRMLAANEARRKRRLLRNEIPALCREIEQLAAFLGRECDPDGSTLEADALLEAVIAECARLQALRSALYAEIEAPLIATGL